MKRPPIRIRTFILGTVLVLLLLPALAAGAAWLIERDHQQTDIQQRLNTAAAYLTSHRTEMQEPASVQAFARLLDRLDLLSQVVIAAPSEKSQLYLSPALGRGQAGRSVKAAAAAAAGFSASWADDRRLIPVAGSKSQARASAILVTDLYYRPASRTTRALVALLTGIIVLLAGLAVAVWLAGRWMVDAAHQAERTGRQGRRRRPRRSRSRAAGSARSPTSHRRSRA